MSTHRIITLCLFAALTTATAAVANPRYGIIPQPKSLTPKEGVFELRKSVGITVEDPLFTEVAEDFRAQVETVSGWSLDGTEAMIVFRKAEELDLEEYHLTVTPETVIIEAAAINGAFYGIQTLYQLLPEDIYSPVRVRKVRWEIPCCEISDGPAFPYRGFLLDCGRYFYPKEDVMKFIDIMAMHKQNMFHWHLTEDQGWRIQIDKYPRLTEVGAWRKETAFHSGIGNGIPHGGFYTKDDIREVVEYARKRCVTVIPEVEIPGHSTAALAAYPELGCFPDSTYEVETRWGIMKNLYCPTAKTFQFLEDVFTELFELFPSPLYHIGGDEAPKDAWEQSPYCRDLAKVLGLENMEEMQTFFVKRIGDFLKAHGKTVIGWDEILDGGSLDDPIAMSYRGHAPAARGIRRGIRVILTPNRWCYLDNQQDDQADDVAQEIFMPLKKVYNYYPIVDSLPELSRKHIIGHQVCLWTEYIPDMEKAEFMAFPRSVAAAEAGWTIRENKDWESFRARMEKELRRLDRKDIGYCKAYYEVIFNYDRRLPFPKEMDLELDYPDGVIHYTTDGSDPTTKSPIYDGKPFLVDRGSEIRARGFSKKGKPLGKITIKTFLL
ncbi:MAG: beta-N-acetylhexosaminidase [Candidatus Cryptobacteroides sp.]|jgi:hexosaminidase